MDKFSTWLEVKAKAGKEAEVERFFRDMLAIAQSEPGTKTWYALKLNTNTFGIFDTFADEQGREAHVSGAMPKAFFSDANKALFDWPPTVKGAEILAAKITA